MIPNGTYLHANNDSNYKQLTMSAEAYYTLKHWSKQRNGTMSKSVMTYEVLSYAVDEEFDNLDSYESELDDQLELYGYEGVSDLQTVERDDAQDELEQKAANYMEEDDSDYEVGDTVQDVKIWLPSIMVNQVPWGRGWGNKIKDALVTLRASPWDGRNQRIETKKQVLEYERKGIEPDDDIAQTIVSGCMSEFVSEVRFTDEVQSEDEYVARADEWDTWEDRKERLYEVYQNSDISQKDMIEMVEDAHGIGTSWHARNCIDDFAREYEAYEYAPVDNLDVSPDNFAEQIETYDDSDANRATIIGHLFSYYEKEGNKKVQLSEIAKLLANADVIRRDDRKVAAKELNRLDKKVGIHSYKKMERGEVFLYSYDDGQDALPAHSIKKMNQVIEDADIDLSFESISKEPFVSVEDDMVRQAMLERCLINEGGKSYKLSDIVPAIDTTGWNTPAMYESVEDWVSEFSVVEVIDGNNRAIMVKKYR